MNCSSCGAKNEADARFCAECGTPIEDSDTDNQATVIGMSLRDLDTSSDEMSMTTEAAEDKTVAVDYAEAEAAALPNVEETPAKPAPEPEKPVSSSRTPTPTSTPVPVIPANTDGGATGNGADNHTEAEEGGQSRAMWLVIGVLALLFVCCCCFSLGIGGAIGSDPGLFEDLIDELTLLSGYVTFV